MTLLAQLYIWNFEAHLQKARLYHAGVTVDEDMKIRNCPEYPDHFCSVWINSRNILFILVCANCNCGLCYYPILR